MPGLCLRELSGKRPNRIGMDSTGGNILCDGWLATRQIKEVVSKKAGCEGSVYVRPTTGYGVCLHSTTKDSGKSWCC